VFNINVPIYQNKTGVIQKFRTFQALLTLEDAVLTCYYAVRRMEQTGWLMPDLKYTDSEQMKGKQAWVWLKIR
jgi:hypothetical protein